MTQDESWEKNYHAFLNFMTEQKKRPSKHRTAEHPMLNWLKYQKKRMAQGKMKPERIDRFKQLLEVADQYLRKNQYAYTHQGNADDNFCGNLFSND
ncbi:MAG: helicase associated domain-containing protein [Bacteroidaceae bacterium]|nr:helicase associated domain-containing protein [Bacteroidaceae bacterium]MDE6721884.1 helicase associated domain-containing protein [Bacteroidaceae bacterium]MDE7118196.1 helicase associated domain-containing protein [Bacteroidaceae bacterium]